MRKFLHRLWWSAAALHIYVDRLAAFGRWVGRLLARAFWPTLAFVRNRRVDASLVLVGALVALYTEPPGAGGTTREDIFYGVAWGLGVVACLILIVAAWNLLLAPYRVYKERSDADYATIRQLQRELEGFRYPIEREAQIAQKRSVAASCKSALSCAISGT